MIESLWTSPKSRLAAAFIALAVLLVLHWTSPADAERHEPVGDPAALENAITGPAAIVDGDTIDVAGERIRLEGIDAPETGQTCTRGDGSAWSCGRVAGKALGLLIGSRDVSCLSRGRDIYGRRLATCYVAGRNINAAMVRAGYAWAFVKYSTTYVAEEGEARARAAGVWQGRAEAPWLYRHRGWNVAEKQAPQGCAIKGNISRHGHIYHMPWSPWYDRVSVDPRRGEAWFCSEADAIRAGFRPAATN